LNIIKNPRTSFGVFGGHGSHEVAIGDHGSLKIAFILFLLFFLLFGCIIEAFSEFFPQYLSNLLSKQLVPQLRLIL
jgi:hypothetical protein